MFTVHKILCPFDQRFTSSDALRQAQQLAKHYGAELLVLYVLPTHQKFDGLPPSPAFTTVESPLYEAELKRHAQQKLADELRNFLMPDVATKLLVRRGQVEEEILRVAEHEHCDLIVMQPHSAPGWHGHLFGTTCESMLRQKRFPIWLSRPALSAPFAGALASEVVMPTGASRSQTYTPPQSFKEYSMLTVRKILCPTDGSEPSCAAVDVASDMALQFGAELCILHVQEPLEPVLNIVSQAQFQAEYEREAQDLITKVVTAHVDKGVEWRALVRQGQPAVEILHAVDEERPDLLVIATHGRTGWRRLLLGSVAEPVARLAACPVLTVHEPTKGKEAVKSQEVAKTPETVKSPEASQKQAAEPVPAFSNQPTISSAMPDAWQIREEDFPEKGTREEKLRFLLRYAILAPSNRNSQPWLWKIDDDVIELYADYSRSLPLVDPYNRELLIACGAALFNLRVALRYFGLGDEVHILPEAQLPDLLARIVTEPASSATIGGSSREDSHLFASLTQRHTVRGPFKERRLPANLHIRLKEAARAEGALLRFVEDEEREKIAHYIEQAGTFQARDAAFCREWANWVRSNEEESYDGISRRALRLEDEQTEGTYRTAMARAARDGAGAQLAPSLVLLETESDLPSDWLAAGAALERVLLLACEHDFFASYYNQPVEVTEFWRKLRNELCLLCYPQMLFRLGVPVLKSTIIPTPRRPIEEVIVSDMKSHRALNTYLTERSAARIE